MERLWDSVELPKTSDDLKAWTEPPPELDQLPIDDPVPPPPPPPVEEPKEEEDLGATLPSTTLPDEVEASDNEKDEVHEAVLEEETSIVLRDEAPITELPKNTQTPEGVLGWILHILGLIMNFFLRRNKKDE